MTVKVNVTEEFQLVRLLRKKKAKNIEFTQSLFADNTNDTSIEYENKGNDNYLIIGESHGLLGPFSSLPGYLIDTLKQLYHSGEYALLDFLQVFNNRLIKLANKIVAYRSIVYRLEFEDSDKDRNEIYKEYLSSFTGSLTSDSPVLIPSTLLIRNGSRSLNNLKQLLEFYFDFKIEIKAKKVEKFVIPADVRSTTSGSPLGAGMVLGESYKGLGKSITITMNFDDYQQYKSLKANNEVIDKIYQLSNLYLSSEVKIQLKMQYQGKERNSWVLGSIASGGAKALGVDSSITSQSNIEQHVTIK